MKKEEFKQALRKKLGEVPFETRKKWDETNLFAWWGRAKAEDVDLTLDRSRADDLWQHVPGACRDLIGPKAIR